MKTRKATEADLHLVESLQQQIFAKCDRVPVDLAEWWVAEDSGEAVGFAGLKVLFDCSVFLCLAGVLPSHRGHGVQRRLIHARTRWARVHGFTHAYSYTLLNNPASSNSLIRAGFRLQDPAESWFGVDVLTWEKKLS